MGQEVAKLSTTQPAIFRFRLNFVHFRSLSHVTSDVLQMFKVKAKVNESMVIYKVIALHNVLVSK